MRHYRLGLLTLASMEPAELFDLPGKSLRHIVTVNGEIFVLAHEEPMYSAILSRTVNTIDGRAVQWLTALLNEGPPPRKLSGSDLLPHLAAHCRDTGRKLFLLGASERANTLACRNLRVRYPGIQLEGFSPLNTERVDEEAWNASIFTVLERFRPEYLVVAFGSPKGEYWIDSARLQLETLGVRFAAGFGGAVNFASGLVPRAPRWVQEAGLEWFFRLIMEPRRLRRTVRMLRMPYHAARHMRGL